MGCESGNVSHQLANNGFWNIIGFDLSEPNCRYIREHLQNAVDVTLGTVHKLPFKSNTFDVVIAKAIVEHIEAVQQLLSVANLLLIFRFKAPIRLLFLWILNYWTASTFRKVFK